MQCSPKGDKEKEEPDQEIDDIHASLKEEERNINAAGTIVNRCHVNNYCLNHPSHIRASDLYVGPMPERIQWNNEDHYEREHFP